MKIGIDARMYGSAVTGIGNYTKYLTDKLFEIDDRNEYVMFMRKQDYEKFTPPHSRVKKIEANIPWYSWQEQLALGKKFNKASVDFFHFPHFNVPITYQGKFIVTIHDITPKFFPGPRIKKSIIRKLGYNYVFNSALRKSKKIIAVSNHTKKQILDNFKIDSGKIKVVHNGFSDTFQKVADCGIIKKLKSKHGITKPFIFYIGVWRDHKNIPGLLKSFEIIRNKHNLDIQLVLGGDNRHQDPKILQTINSLSLDNNLITPGFIPEEELSTFYSAAEVTVIPSFCEGFGFLALESISCNTPVAASNTTSVPEILGDGGLYFNPDNPNEMAEVIAKILNNKDLRQKLIEKGREVLPKYSWEKCAGDILDIYKSI